jgi:hypothetical protein
MEQRGRKILEAIAAAEAFKLKVSSVKLEYGLASHVNQP